MSTVLPEAASTTDEPLVNLLFDYPGADVILRSQDAHHFRVPKVPQVPQMLMPLFPLYSYLKGAKSFTAFSHSSFP